MAIPQANIRRKCYGAADAVAPLHREFPESHRRSARRRCRSGDPRRRGLRQANWTPDQDREAAVQGSVSSAACSSTVSVAFSCSVGRLAVLPQDPLDQYPALAPATFSRMLQAMMTFRRTADTQPARSSAVCRRRAPGGRCRSTPARRRSAQIRDHATHDRIGIYRNAARTSSIRHAAMRWR